MENNKQDNNNPKSSDSILRALVDLRDCQIQKTRIQFSNRVSAIEKGNDSDKQIDVVRKWKKTFKEHEKELDKDIAKSVKEYPIFEYVVKIRGIGPMLAARMIAMIDIKRAVHMSCLWRYAGHSVDTETGKRERNKKGEKSHDNKRLKSTMYNVAISLLKSKSHYSQVYYNAKHYYEQGRNANSPFILDKAKEMVGKTVKSRGKNKKLENVEEAAEYLAWSKGHIHMASLSKMIKIFLCHLWETWRDLEGLDKRESYVFEKLGHTVDKKYKREDFGWDLD